MMFVCLAYGLPLLMKHTSVKYLPLWTPGATFLTTAKARRKLLNTHYRTMYQWSKENSV